MDTAIPDTKALLGQLRATMPIRMEPLTVGARKTGLVIVDEVNGFATVGRRSLAPRAERAGHADGRGDRPAGARLQRAEAADPGLPRYPCPGQAGAALPAPLRGRHRRGEPGAAAGMAGAGPPHDLGAQGL